MDGVRYISKKLVFVNLVLFIVSVLTPLKTYAAGTLVSDALGLEAGNLDAYFTNLFNLALVIGAVLAVLIIATAGLQYMTTDAISGKGESKDRIWQAVLGLLMLLSVYLFFKEINPNILNLDLKLDTVEVTGSSLDTTTSGTPTSIVPPVNPSSIYWPSNDAQRNGVCGVGAAGSTLCGYSSISQCESVSSQCATYTISQTPVTTFLEECTAANSSTCTGQLEGYDFWSQARDPETRERVFTFYESREDCIATTGSGSQCTRDTSTAAAWDRRMNSNTRIRLQSPYIVGKEVTIELPGDPASDLPDDPFHGQTGSIVEIFTTSNGSVRYIVEFSDGQRINTGSGTFAR